METPCSLKIRGGITFRDEFRCPEQMRLADEQNKKKDKGFRNDVFQLVLTKKSAEYQIEVYDDRDQDGLRLRCRTPAHL